MLILLKKYSIADIVTKHLKIYLQILVILVFIPKVANCQSLTKHDTLIVDTGFSISVFDQVNLRDAKAAIVIWGNDLLDYLGEKYKVVPIIYKNNEDIIYGFNNGKIDLLSVLSTDYFELKNKINIEPTLITKVNGNYGYEFVILVKENNGINTIKDLKNKSIIFYSSEFEKLMMMWTKTTLSENGIKNESFFGNIKKVNKPSQAILPVFFGQKDACIVTKNAFNIMLELNPQVSSLKIIEQSPILINSIMCLNVNLSDHIKDILRNIGDKMNESNSGKQLLKIFKSEGIINLKPEYLSETKNLYDKYQTIYHK